MPSQQAVIKYVEKYRSKATVVRQIHSNIAESKRKWDIRHTLATIILGALFTFTGFMGTDRIFDTIFEVEPTPRKTDMAVNEKSQDEGVIQGRNLEQKHVNPETFPIAKVELSGQSSSKPSLDQGRASQVPKATRSSVSRKLFDFVFNGAALLLFITSVMNLIYRWKEEHTAHFQGVVKLTTYINWLDEFKLIGILTADVYALKKIRGRYQAIVESLPPNDEKDYLRAKLSLIKKERGTPEHADVEMEDNQPLEGSDFIEELIRTSPLLMSVLIALRTVPDQQLWLAGGSIRNHVWDQLTGRVTIQDDFDIVYFSTQDLSPLADQEIRKKVSESLPLVLKISVKNQARMHITNNEPQTKSFAESIAQWPETATAIAVRMVENGNLEIFAPYGFDDLQNMIVRPTPYHSTNRTSYETRKIAKGWKEIWPELTIQP